MTTTLKSFKLQFLTTGHLPDQQQINIDNLTKLLKSIIGFLIKNPDHKFNITYSAPTPEYVLTIYIPEYINQVVSSDLSNIKKFKESLNKIYTNYTTKFLITNHNNIFKYGYPLIDIKKHVCTTCLVKSIKYPELFKKILCYLPETGISTISLTELEEFINSISITHNHDLLHLINFTNIINYDNIIKILAMTFYGFRGAHREIYQFFKELGIIDPLCFLNELLKHINKSIYILYEITKLGLIIDSELLTAKLKPYITPNLVYNWLFNYIPYIHCKKKSSILGLSILIKILNNINLPQIVKSICKIVSKINIIDISIETKPLWLSLIDIVIKNSIKLNKYYAIPFSDTITTDNIWVLRFLNKITTYPILHKPPIHFDPLVWQIQQRGHEDRYMINNSLAIYDGHGGLTNKHIVDILKNGYIDKYYNLPPLDIYIKFHLQEYLPTDKKGIIKIVKNSCKIWNTLAFYLGAIHGSTASMFLIYGKYIISITVGDSPLVLTNGMDILFKSIPHNASNHKEVKRLSKIGITFTNNGRISANNDINISRAFGNYTPYCKSYNYYSNPIICVPTVNVWNISKLPYHCHLIIMTDGLIDSVPLERLVDNIIELDSNEHLDAVLRVLLQVKTINGKNIIGTTTDDCTCIVYQLKN